MEITRRNTIKGGTVLLAGTPLLGSFGATKANANEHHPEHRLFINGSPVPVNSGVDFTMYDGDLDFGYQDEIPIDEMNIESILAGLFEYSRRNGDFEFEDLDNLHTSSSSNDLAQNMLGQSIYPERNVYDLLFDGEGSVYLYRTNPWVIVARYLVGGVSIIITPLMASTLSTFGHRLGNDLYEFLKAKFLNSEDRLNC